VALEFLLTQNISNAGIFSMSIKELFNGKPDHELLLKKMTELEKRLARLDASEAQAAKVSKTQNGAPRQQSNDGVSRTVRTSGKDKTDPKEKKKHAPKRDALWEEMSILVESFLAKAKIMDKRMGHLEKAVFSLMESRTDIQKRLEAIENRLHMLESGNKEKDNKRQEQPVVIKEIHIDKFYLDKYEQNNTFGQLGIKSLSGALNIGATYGREVLPKDVSAQIKEDMEEMKNMYKQKQNEAEPSPCEESGMQAEHFEEIPLDGPEGEESE
jgi:hypothetical protein